jgi:hypothetical protein
MSQCTPVQIFVISAVAVWIGSLILDPPTRATSTVILNICFIVCCTWSLSRLCYKYSDIVWILVICQLSSFATVIIGWFTNPSTPTPTEQKKNNTNTSVAVTVPVIPSKQNESASQESTQPSTPRSPRVKRARVPKNNIMVG